MNWLELAKETMVKMAKVADETVEYHYGPETLLLASIAESLAKIAAASESYYTLMRYN